MLKNIYCDETCHLEFDESNTMAIGLIECPQEKIKRISYEINKIKEKHHISLSAELKWTKITFSQIDLYKELIDYFSFNDFLNARVIVIPNKKDLDHKRFHQNHDDWYYKMYYNLLKHLLTEKDRYKIYIDIKDSHSYEKQIKLLEVLSNSFHEFEKGRIKQIQSIKSEEVPIMQLVDIIIGALCYATRYKESYYKKNGKTEIIKYIEKKLDLDARKTNYSNKLNIFIWNAR